MLVSYDIFTGAFLSKITEFDLLLVDVKNRTIIIDGYMKRAISQFQHICKCDLITTADDTERTIDVELESDDDLTELVDIISEVKQRYICNALRNFICYKLVRVSTNVCLYS